jgi:CSLREA domain-containing protein
LLSGCECFGGDCEFIYDTMQECVYAHDCCGGETEGGAQYPTLLDNDGARHTIVPDLYLGAGVDADLDGQPDPNALGDDNDGNDDEDGVSLTTALVPGNQVDVSVTVTGQGYLNAWIDFNADGDWDDANEQILAGLQLDTGTHRPAFNVPDDAVLGETYARFRYSSTPGLAPTGLAGDGEVEDYQFTVGTCECLTYEHLGNGLYRFDTCMVTPNGLATFLYGRQPGQLFLPDHDVTIDVTDPVYFAQGVADPNGHALAIVSFPSDFFDRTVYFQVFEQKPNPRVCPPVTVAPALADGFEVNSTADLGDNNLDDGVCDTGRLVGVEPECTLRAAIQQANTKPNSPGGLDVIMFDIPGAGPHAITPVSPLPAVTDAVVIDGTSEPDFAGTPVVELDGSSLGGGADGLRITTGNSTVRGLAIFGFPGDGIDLRSAGGNTIAGNHIGTDSTGTTDLGNGERGVFVYGVNNNVIGGVGADDGNVISGNDEYGVSIQGGGTGNRIEGNLIGTNAAGTAALGNAMHGVFVSRSPDNSIGGLAAGAGNVISGNEQYGVSILGTESTGNLVAGNLVGTDQAGAKAIGNGVQGVKIENAAGNTVGGLSAQARNVISGNGRHGVGIFRGASGGNTIVGNYIGTDVTGSTSVANGVQGIQVFDSWANQIGGTSTDARNVISGNGAHGIQVRGLLSTNNVIEGNFIGTDVSGTSDLGNGLQGIIVSGATNTRIGGKAAGAGNLISGNDGHGVWIVTSLSENNVVEGNLIGTDVAGSATLGNALYGVVVSNGSSNRIGGTATGAGNVIAGNGSQGVAILKPSATGNVIQRNSIFTNGGRGIDLSGHGFSPNDPEDPDTGPNNMQNFPEITSVVLTGGNLEVTYSVPSATTNSAYDLTVEFFIADANGQEGKTFLDEDTYPAASAMLARSATISAGGAQVGDEIIATATDANGNTSEFSFTRSVSSPLLAAGGEASQESRVEGQELSADDLSPIVDAAIDHMIAAGFAAELFSSVQVTIADLPGATLGLATGTSIVIDVDAAGYGWYVGPDLRNQSPEPLDSDAASTSRLWTPDSRLRMDLLTVVMHELGHVLGLEDVDPLSHSDDVMSEILAPGVRRTTLADATDAIFGSSSW